MSFLITWPNHHNLIYIDSLCRTDILLLLLESKEIFGRKDKPSSESSILYLRHVFNNLDYLCKKPQQTIEFISVKKSFQLIDILLYFFIDKFQAILMGNQACCQQRLQNSGQYRYDKFDKKSKQQLLLSNQYNSQPINGKQIIQKDSKNLGEENEHIINLTPYKQKYSFTDRIKPSNTNSLQIKQDQQNLSKQRMRDHKNFKVRSQGPNNKHLQDNDGISIIKSLKQNHKKKEQDQFLDGESMFVQSSNLLNLSFQEYNKHLMIINSNQELPHLTEEAAFTAQYLSYIPNYLDLFDLNFKDLIYTKYGKDFYHGKQEQEKKYPHGYGRFFKQNGSFFAGNFVSGKANGEGIYVFPDGSYYKGMFKSNKANDVHGLYKSKQLMYSGPFVDNCFDGQGSQSGINHFFKGRYKKNNKVKGVLKWKTGKQLYEYQGTFNENGLFEGTGVLKEPKGKYSGQFVNGVKHGKAIYIFKRGLKYEGEYVFGQRQGLGTLFNIGSNGDFRLAYKGQFKKGLPDGKGEVPLSNGQLIQTTWIEGVDSQTIL